MRANRSEVLFVDYIAEHLNAGGRAGVIVPEGIIFQASNAYKELRKYLVEEGYLYAVVSLPAGVFNPYSGVKTSILLMDRDLARRADSILFVKIEADGYDLGAQRRPIERNDVPEALRLVRAFQADPGAAPSEGSIVQVVAKKRLARDADYNLSAERYKANGIVNHKWPMARLGDVISTITPPMKLQKEAYLLSGKFPVIDQGQDFIAGSTDNELAIVEFQEPLIIFGDHTCNVKYVDFPFAQGADGIKIIKPSKEFNPKFLFYILRSLEIKPDGYKRHFSKLKEVRIPKPPLEVQQSIVAEIESYQKVIDGARQVIENYKPTIPIDPSWPLVKLGELLAFEYGKPLKEENRDGGTYPVFGSNGVVGWHSEYLVKGPFVIVGRKGSAGSVNYSSLSGYPIDTTYYVKILDEQKIELKFAYFVLLQAKLNEVNIQSGVPGLNRNDAYQIQVSLPPLSIQQKIVADLEENMAIIESNKKLIFNLEEKIASVINKIWGDVE